MRIEQFFQYIDSPEHLNQDTLQYITEWRNAYPFFQTAHLLYIKNLYMINSERYSAELKKSSAFILDKKKLYKFLFILYNPATKPSKPPETLETEQKNSSPETNSKTPDTGAASQNTGKELFFIVDEQGTEIDYDKTIERTKSTVQETPPTTGKHERFTLEQTQSPQVNASKQKLPGSPVQPSKSHKKTYLIDQFIKNQPEKIQPNEEEPEEKEDLSQESATNTPEIYTETLANIYANQGYYKKAIEIFQQLSLQSPEKNDYFASKINELKKHINKSSKNE